MKRTTASSFSSCCCIFLVVVTRVVEAQISGTEVTMRSFNSVDIQICADSMLSTERAGLQAALQTNMQGKLLTTAVYYTRYYTTAGQGTVCYMFVYQAPNPQAAREAIQTLMQDSGTMDVAYLGATVPCRITAIPWVGEDVGPMGLDWQFGANDVMLWGGCMGGLLTACSIGVCCFVQLSANKETKRADEVLKKDRETLKKIMQLAVGGHDNDEEDKSIKQKESSSSSSSTKKNHTSNNNNSSSSSSSKNNTNNHHNNKSLEKKEVASKKHTSV